LFDEKREWREREENSGIGLCENGREGKGKEKKEDEV
jgi:hypothetical protein